MRGIELININGKLELCLLVQNFGKKKKKKREKLIKKIQELV